MSTDVDIQLSDMLESYPPVTTPNIQTIITAKKEFSELASYLGEQRPPKGGYLKHQKFTHRAMRAFGDFVIIDEAGTGKSCSVLGFMEYCRKEAEKAKIDPTTADEKVAHYKRFVILSKGKTQKSELRNQLACVCSDGYYESGIVERSTNERSRKSNLTAVMKRAGYLFTTYKTFTHEIDKQYPLGSDLIKYPDRILSPEENIRLGEENARLAEEYADTVFWIDEGHNVPADPNNHTKFKEKQLTYATLFRVFHAAKRSKRIITSATPMINEAKPLALIMNLILPLDGVLPPGYDYKNATANDIRVLFPRLPVGTDIKTLSPAEAGSFFVGQMNIDTNFDQSTLADLEPYFRGRIEFIRASNTGAIPENQGILQKGKYEINGVVYQSQLVLYETAMSDFQTFGKQGGGGGYYQAMGFEGQRDQLRTQERQASNFIFPDGYWGEGITEEEKRMGKEAKAAKARQEIAGPLVGDITQILVGGGRSAEMFSQESIEKRAFRRYVLEKGNGYVATPEFLIWLSDINFIRTLSCKYAEILRIETTEPGNGFIYFEYVRGSGAIVFTLCLEALGFDVYDGSVSMFEGASYEELKPMCGSSNEHSTRKIKMKSTLEGAKPRYALLTEGTTDLQFNNIREAYNSYENRHGHYIKELVSSRVGRDAINLSNVLRIHLAGGEWNESTAYQALSRGVRATSHEDLIREEKEKLIAEGKDPNTARIAIKIFRHSATTSDGIHNVDLRMYSDSEKKDRSIKRIMRFMKQCSIGCQVHYNRNVRDTDIDYTPACDYDICRYKCVDPAVYYNEETQRYENPPPELLDYSTYDVSYIEEVVKEASVSIIELYRQWNTFTLDNISHFLPAFRRKVLIMALESIISNKMPLTDRFGYTCYLREDGGSFFLDRTYPVGVLASYAMSYYTQGVIGIEEKILPDIVVDLEADEHQEVLRELETMDPKNPMFNRALEGISIEGQATILENVMIRYALGERLPFLEAIIVKFQRVIFAIHEPITELSKVYESRTTLRRKRGRKKNMEIKRKTQKLNTAVIDTSNIVTDQNTELVFLHTLYSQVVGQTAYSTIARFNKGEGRTRLLKPSLIKDGWRDLNEIELPVYNAFIQIEISRRLEPFREKGVYGFILPDGKFRISNKLLEGTKAKSDPRSVRRGKNCTTWYSPALIDVMWEIGVPAAPINYETEYFGPNDKDLLIRKLIDPKREKRTYEELATWDIQRLTYYYGWYTAKQNTGDGRKTKKINRAMICDIIKQKMEQTGRIME